ncbi:MAG: tRNA preQ1(34) S-adenosylmethionine ribosyltransferase-isomerase QueA [Oscillospiraceae bacterium]|jgi:S-adenosylmethionine:tRNA ribosyltransferase-isomerase|nr:tRNA preQ1(34) S-adenosylmethionine ribosyltransferase-isomerase QueA [Oscillospiraceae bacterium]
MNTSDFYYALPPERIAQTPAEPRDSARMMVLRRGGGEILHDVFRNIGHYLKPGDALILNDTKVLPARLHATKEGTGARVEFLLLRPLEQNLWECLAGPGKKAKPGDRFVFGQRMRGVVMEALPNGNRTVQFFCEGSFYEALDEIGEMPLPHYITQPLDDATKYQTVYARENGSAAAPTAGLHFTPELLERLRGQGVLVGFVTLHVGLGTFRPVKARRIEDHEMHSEHYSVPEATAALINATRARGGRVISVGTTCCRTLEAVMRDHGTMLACEGWTDIFIYPGYPFRCVDALLTNFHLPESTLIMLVSAFYGREKTLAAYETAVREGYRFYSFGDCMLVE